MPVAQIDLASNSLLRKLIGYGHGRRDPLRCGLALGFGAGHPSDPSADLKGGLRGQRSGDLTFLRQRQAGNMTTCVFCGSDNDRGDWVRCMACHATYHEECWRKNNGCTSPECKWDPGAKHGKAPLLRGSEGPGLAKNVTPVSERFLALKVFVLVGVYGVVVWLLYWGFGWSGLIAGLAVVAVAAGVHFTLTTLSRKRSE